MSGLKARVENGYLVMRERTSLPEGTVLELVPANDGDDLSAEERAELLASIEQGAEDFANGDVEDAVAFSKRLSAQQ